MIGVYSILESCSQDSADRVKVLDSERVLSKTNCWVSTLNYCCPRLYRYCLEVNWEYLIGKQDKSLLDEANLYNIFCEKHVHIRLRQYFPVE